MTTATFLDLPAAWRCRHTDDSTRCTYQAFYNGYCYRHRLDAPDPDQRYVLSGHHCSGCER